MTRDTFVVLVYLRTFESNTKVYTFSTFESSLDYLYHAKITCIMIMLSKVVYDMILVQVLYQDRSDVQVDYVELAS